MTTEALKALARIEKKLERHDKLFKHSKERDDIKIVQDCILEYRKINKVEISQRDLRDVFIYAFRYTLGRSTYAVSTMAVLIQDNAKNLSDADLNLYIREINEAIKENRCGMYIDCNSWIHTAEYLQIELDSRR